MIDYCQRHGNYCMCCDKERSPRHQYSKSPMRNVCNSCDRINRDQYGGEMRRKRKSMRPGAAMERGEVLAELGKTPGYMCLLLLEQNPDPEYNIKILRHFTTLSAYDAQVLYGPELTACLVQICGNHSRNRPIFTDVNWDIISLTVSKAALRKRDLQDQSHCHECDAYLNGYQRVPNMAKKGYIYCGRCVPRCRTCRSTECYRLYKLGYYKCQSCIDSCDECNSSCGWYGIGNRCHCQVESMR